MPSKLSAMAAPSLPIQVGFIDWKADTVISPGSFRLTSLVAEQLLASVTVTV